MNKLTMLREDKKLIFESIEKLSLQLKSIYNFKYFINPLNKKSDLNNDCLLEMDRIDNINSQFSYLKNLKDVHNQKWQKSFSEYIGSLLDLNIQTQIKNQVEIDAWNNNKGKYLEILYLLALLKNYPPLSKQIREVVIMKNTVIPVLEGNNEIFIWIRPDIHISKSGMKACPDIVITSTKDQPSKENIINIIECKCVEDLSSGTIRQEFGKAYDVDVVKSYIIISYYSVKKYLKDASRALGLELSEFSLYGPDRESYLKNEKDLVADITTELIIKVNSNSFRNSLIKTTSKIDEKAIRLRRE